MDNFITELIKMKTKFINSLFIILGCFLLITLPSFAFSNIYSFLIQFGYSEVALNIFQYFNYIDPCGCSICNLFYKYHFDTIFFKISLLFIIILYLLQYRKIEFKIKNEYFVLYVVAGAFAYHYFGILLLQYNNAIFYINYPHMLLNIIFSTFLFTSLFLYPFIIVLIIHDTWYTFLTKIILVVLISIFIQSLFGDFYYVLINSFDEFGNCSTVFQFLLDTFNDNTAECMNAQPKYTYEECLLKHKQMAKTCKQVIITRDPATMSECQNLLNIYQAQCKEILPNRK